MSRSPSIGTDHPSEDNRSDLDIHWEMAEKTETDHGDLEYPDVRLKDVALDSSPMHAWAAVGKEVILHGMSKTYDMECSALDNIGIPAVATFAKCQIPSCIMCHECILKNFEDDSWDLENFKSTQRGQGRGLCRFHALHRLRFCIWIWMFVSGRGLENESLRGRLMALAFERLELLDRMLEENEKNLYVKAMEKYVRGMHAQEYDQVRERLVDEASGIVASWDRALTEATGQLADTVTRLKEEKEEIVRSKIESIRPLPYHRSARVKKALDEEEALVKACNHTAALRAIKQNAKLEASEKVDFCRKAERAKLSKIERLERDQKCKLDNFVTRAAFRRDLQLSRTDHDKRYLERRIGFELSKLEKRHAQILRDVMLCTQFHSQRLTKYLWSAVDQSPDLITASIQSSKELDFGKTLLAIYLGLVLAKELSMPLSSEVLSGSMTHFLDFLKGDSKALPSNFLSPELRRQGGTSKIWKSQPAVNSSVFRSASRKNQEEGEGFMKSLARVTSVARNLRQESSKSERPGMARGRSEKRFAPPPRGGFRF